MADIKYREYIVDGKPVQPGELLYSMEDGKVEVVYASNPDENGVAELGFNATNFKSALWRSGNWSQETYPLYQFDLSKYKRLSDLTQEDVERSWGMYD